MIIIIGDTYSHKDAIRATGAKWDRTRKCWVADDDNKAAAKLLVELIGPTFRSAERDSAGNPVARIPRRRAPAKDGFTRHYERLERDLRSGKYGPQAALDAD